ncbi:MAG TPA: hypothetical protein PKZ53_10050 [Acidobacteriota bacterium]|nr:hypothetical protein [Acidobacteriota bacterium]
MKPDNQFATRKRKEIEPLLTDVVRAERNIERWPAIWTPANSRNTAKVRILERQKFLEDGSRLACQVKITPLIEYGNLTTEDQKVFLGLIKLWEEAYKPEELNFSLRQLAKCLDIASWSGEVGETLKKSLWKLRGTLFIWTNSYCDGVTKEFHKHLNSFTILSELEIFEKETAGSTNKQACRLKFYPLIEKNLRNRYTQPTFYNVVIGFQSGLAQLLYQYLELTMVDKTNFERTSKNLFEELAIEGKKYQYKSARKRALESAIRELDNVPIPTGVLRVSLEETKKNDDWKLVIKKIAQMLLPVGQADKEAEAEPHITDLSDFPNKEAQNTRHQPIEHQDQATELVQHFHKTFFSLDVEEPGAHELKQAADLIKKHGFEVAKYVVNYAYRQSQETHFNIATFGGILHYVGRAKARYKKDQQAQERIRQTEERERSFETCPLGCWRNGGRVFWVKIDDQGGSINQMDCLHDEVRHKEMEHKDKIKIAMTCADLKS